MRVIQEKDLNGGSIVFIKMNKLEAIRTINSLSNQMIGDSANSGRAEMYDGNTYFSISVDEE